MSVTFTTVVDRVMTSVSLMDNVILGTSVVNVSTIALLGVTIIALETLNIGVASVEVETSVLTIKKDDDDVTLWYSEQGDIITNNSRWCGSKHCLYRTEGWHVQRIVLSLLLYLVVQSKLPWE